MAKHYINPPPTSEPSEGVSSLDARKEFARRLQALRSAKGWNQSELARHASKHMTAGTDFNRSNISAYERAVTLPRTEHLHALAKTLGVNPADLIPARGVASVNTKASPVSMQDLGDGRVWLRVNSTVPWETALEIIRKVKESDEPTDK